MVIRLVCVFVVKEAAQKTDRKQEVEQVRMTSKWGASDKKIMESRLKSKFSSHVLVSLTLNVIVSLCSVCEKFLLEYKYLYLYIRNDLVNPANTT